jgi:hypothetical protein
MSKYVNEIVSDIKMNPDAWQNCGNGSICKGRIVIGPMSPALLLVMAEVKIDGREQPVTYGDQFKLEKALRYWFRNVPLCKIIEE